LNRAGLGYSYVSFKLVLKEDVKIENVVKGLTNIKEFYSFL